ncbi:MAG: hypothetical protein NTY06_00035 [Candidatus Gottesmanbacteria bacterium]|nr:hypothetical protein [Candidatus Gottesmanbacteria bacterium]
MIDVIPGILEKEWEMIAGRLRLVTGFVDWVQIDVADNTMVPNTTFLDFSRFPQIPQIPQPASSAGGLEAHLMVANPEKYIKAAADAGFKRLIAHVEAHDLRIFLDQVTYEHVEVGIAIDGPTEFEAIEPFLEEVDFVLVMMVEAGFSGGTFLPECIEKIKSIHSYLPDLPIEVSGGISDTTARLVREAGATRLVSTSYIFKDPANIAAAIERLKEA